jgi:Amt family ammonium transporter
MACGVGGIVGLLVYRLYSGCYSLCRGINCAIAGMVSLCAGCNLFPTWAAILVAATGAVAYLLASGLIVLLRIDDPVDAIAVHGAGGIVGILSVPVFMEGGLVYGYSEAAIATLRINALGAGVISGYNLLLGVLLFGALRLAGRLRKDEVGGHQRSALQVTEQAGSDLVHHGEESYPAAAWLQLEVAGPCALTQS